MHPLDTNEQEPHRHTSIHREDGSASPSNADLLSEWMHDTVDERVNDVANPNYTPNPA